VRCQNGPGMNGITDPSPLRAAMIRALGSSAMTSDELFTALHADDRLASETLLRQRFLRILQTDTAFAQPGGKVCFLPALAEGISWTVRVDAEDASNGYVRMHPALSPIGWWLVGDGADLIDDADAVLGRLTTDGLWLDGVDTDVVCGPTGWLNEVAGGWATFTVTNRAVRLLPIDPPPVATDRQIAAVATGYEASVKTTDAVLFGGEHRELSTAQSDHVILEAIIADRESFVTAQVPYLTDLFTAAGLEQQRQIVALAGFDWDALRTRQTRSRIALLHGLDDRSIDQLLLLSGACQLFAADGVGALGATEDERDGAAILLAATLEDGDVAGAFLNDYLERVGTTKDVAAFADELNSRMEGVPLFGLHWIRARCIESTGDVRQAVSLLEAIVGADCEHRPALLDAAAVAADRGDAKAAAKLLVRAGLDYDPAEHDPENYDRDNNDTEDAVLLWREIAPFANHRPKATAQRNDRCPCGSGKKYKVCHLGSERHSLDDRASWLWEKLARYVRREDPTILDDLADEMTESQPGLFRQMATSPFTIDLALHEHEMLAEFLESRGWLLPEDEQLLAAQWSAIDRGVFEVLDVHLDGFRLRNIGQGETITVVNLTPAPGTQAGATILGRPLPVGDRYRAFGGFMVVPLPLVNPLVDAIHAGDRYELVAHIASMLRPPGLRNAVIASLSHDPAWVR
jgi:hypothetical protein